NLHRLGTLLILQSLVLQVILGRCALKMGQQLPLKVIPPEVVLLADTAVGLGSRDGATSTICGFALPKPHLPDHQTTTTFRANQASPRRRSALCCEAIISCPPPPLWQNRDWVNRRRSPFPHFATVSRRSRSRMARPAQGSPPPPANRRPDGSGTTVI